MLCGLLHLKSPATEGHTQTSRSVNFSTMRMSTAASPHVQVMLELRMKIVLVVVRGGGVPGAGCGGSACATASVATLGGSVECVSEEDCYNIREGGLCITVRACDYRVVSCIWDLVSCVT